MEIANLIVWLTVIGIATIIALSILLLIVIVYFLIQDIRERYWYK